MSRRGGSRLLAAFASLAVVGSIVLAGAGTVSAATTRLVSFSSPGAPADLTLLPSTTMPGGASAYDLTLRNVSNGTLTQVHVTGGDQTPDPTSNASFVPGNICTQNVDGTFSCLPPLPSGTGTDGHPWAATIADVYYPAGVACTFPETAAPYTGFSCSLPNLVSGNAVTIRVLVAFPKNTPISSTGYPMWNAAQWKEGQSSTGSNSDAAYALGSAKVEAASCSSVNKFFPKGLTTASLANTQRDPVDPSITAPCDQTTAVTTANGSLGTLLTVGSDLGSTQCLTGFKCFGGLSIGHLLPQLFDPTLPPAPIVNWYVKWTWSTVLPKANPKGIIHFRDNFDPNDSSTYDVIYFSSKGKCATSTSTGCWTAQNSTNTFFEVYFQTLDNGTGRGF